MLDSSNITVRYKQIWFYTLFIALSVGILSSCSTSKKITAYAEPSASQKEQQVFPPKKSQTGKIIEEAHTWIGTPYKHAGQEKGVGTDCSGFVMMVYQTVTGEQLPRNSAKQAEYCNQVKDEEVAEGDLVFFATGKDPQKISHVGIVIDNKSFIHASSSKGVIVSDLTSNYYRERFLMFGRVPRRKDLITQY